MRSLGLDIGEKRVGVAVSDPTGRVATPLKVLDGRTIESDPTPLRRLVEDYEAERLVVGLPLTMSGDEGPQAARVRTVAQRLAVAVGLPLVFTDERLSSTSIERLMTSAGARRERNGTVDMAAATLILQTYLDMESRRGANEGSV